MDADTTTTAVLKALLSAGRVAGSLPTGREQVTLRYWPGDLLFESATSVKGKLDNRSFRRCKRLAGQLVVNWLKANGINPLGLRWSWAQMDNTDYGNFTGARAIVSPRGHIDLPVPPPGDPLWAQAQENIWAEYERDMGDDT
uniref:Uncharacterized protein n=1 Tax=viral metagenome TaxID=1070528 RepID=A0A6M3LG91_9ZZZZ